MIWANFNLAEASNFISVCNYYKIWVREKKEKSYIKTRFKQQPLYIFEVLILIHFILINTASG